MSEPPTPHPPGTDPPDRLAAALADRYRLDRRLGEGGMATVYLAYDLKHDREVAIKVLRPELAAALGPDRFLREIRIAANLNHPHILALFDSGEADGFLYYVMPYVKGQTLRDRIDTEGELPVDETVRIVREVVDALAFAHAEGVVHRDVKPDNVMLTGGHAILADFGIAKAVHESAGRNTDATTAWVALGTPAYMAPEQAAADSQIDHRADIYAVGALTYELLTGRPPFVGESSQAVLAAHVIEQADPVSTYRDQVSAELEAVVMKCLAKRPADRWQTADEMLPYLDTLTTSSGGMMPTQTLGMGLRRTGVNRGVAAAVVIVIAILGVVLAQSLSSGRAANTIQGERKRLTFSGDIRQVAIGPDGTSLAYTNRVGALFVRDAQADGGVLQRVSSDAFGPTWSPDGSMLLYQEGSTNDIYALPKLSGEATRVLSPQSPVEYGYDYDGSYLIGGGRWIYWGTAPHSVDWTDPDPGSVSGGQLFPVADGVRLWNGGDRVSLSPNSKWIAYLGLREALGGVIGLVATDGSGGSILVEGKALFISSGGRLEWSSQGDALFYMAGTGGITQAIRRVGIDPETGVPDGTDVMVFDGVQPRQFDIAPNGDGLAVVGGSGWYNIYAGMADGGRAIRMLPVTTGTAWTVSPSYSADGGSLAFGRFVGISGQSTIHIRTLATGAERVIRVPEGLLCCVAWSPEERRLAYYALGLSGGVATLTVIDLDTEATTAVGVGAWLSSIDWIPDGTALVFSPTDHSTLQHVDVESGVERTLAFDGLTEVVAGVPSPDGRRVALAARAGAGPLSLWVAELAGGAASNIRGDINGVFAWTDDGILFQDGDAVLWIAPSGGEERMFARSEDLATCSIAGRTVAPSTGAVACAVIGTSTDLWWVEGVGF